MSEVKIQINVLNQLRLLRQSTFKDPLSFLDEDVQNAQRAKATEVHVTVKRGDGTLVIENNGAVLDDPQKLFSIAESGWDDETVKNENPFGIGFFSNISVSDNIKIYTGGKRIDFDVKSMLETGDITLPVCEEHVNVPGFRLELRNFDYSVIKESDIYKRVTNLGRYVSDLDIFLNGEKIEKKDLTEPSTSSPFVIAVEEKTFKGWLALSPYFSRGTVTLFYKGREVMKLEKWYAEGEIHLENGALNLVAPDRKDAIRDMKFAEFTSNISEYLEAIATEATLAGTPNQQETYADAIQWYADVDKAKDKMKFIVVRCNDQGVKYLQKVLTSKKEDGISGAGVATLFLDENARTQPESHLEEVSVEKEVPYAGPTPSTGGGYYGGSSYSPIVKEQEKKPQEGETLFSMDRPKFWVSDKELSKWESKILICKHYDLCLVLATNKFQERILENLEKEGKVFHIKTLSQRIVVKTSLTETQLSLKEKRVMQLFEMISRMFGLSNNAFAVGNLMVSRVLTLPEINVSEEKIEDDVTAIYCDEYKKVYVDRGLLEDVELLIEESFPVVNLQDYKFLLRNLPTLSKELSFVVGKSSSEILEKVVKTLGGE